MNECRKDRRNKPQDPFFTMNVVVLQQAHKHSKAAAWGHFFMLLAADGGETRVFWVRPIYLLYLKEYIILFGSRNFSACEGQTGI